MNKECIYRWETTALIPRKICGNNDELDVYDCHCTDDIHATCNFKKVEDGEQ